MLKLYKIVLFSIFKYALIGYNNDSLPSLKGKNLVFSYLSILLQSKFFFILYSFELSIRSVTFQLGARWSTI